MIKPILLPNPAFSDEPEEATAVDFGAVVGLLPGTNEGPLDASPTNIIFPPIGLVSPAILTN